MRIIDGLLAELEQEAATTRRVLERIPQEHLSWRPRLLGQSVPSVYGPTADENPFAVRA
jgi:hypothetical protein